MHRSVSPHLYDHHHHHHYHKCHHHHPFCKRRKGHPAFTRISEAMSSSEFKRTCCGSDKNTTDIFIDFYSQKQRPHNEHHSKGNRSQQRARVQVRLRIKRDRERVLTKGEVKSLKEEVLESLRLVPYIDSREDGRSSSHKGIVVDHWSRTSRTKFFVLLLELELYTRSWPQAGRSSPMTSRIECAVCVFLHRPLEHIAIIENYRRKRKQ